MGGKESHANACISVIFKLAHGHPGVSECLCVYVDVALDQITQPFLWDYVCVNTKTMLV